MPFHLYLVRHGETVDNVASIIAGVRDSPLTNHGFQQAVRLGQHLNATGVDITHVFASPLQRARITAEQILASQPPKIRQEVSVTPMSSLREQDFGHFEGVHYSEYRQNDNRAASVETADMMANRAHLFIESSLAPLLEGPVSPTVVVVSHGRMLQTLWSHILAWFNPAAVSCDHELLVRTNSIGHARIGAWSNTGYLHVTFIPSDRPATIQTPTVEPLTALSSRPDSQVSAPEEHCSVRQRSWSATISAINGRPHLDGFKRTRGGVGSAQYDPRQSTLNRFFASSRTTSVA